MPQYIALTIGPIYKTFTNVRKTREVWAVSYIFSYLLKSVIMQLRDRKFIMPFIDANGDVFNTKGVGLFPDRFIFESKDGDYAFTEQAFEKVLGEFATVAGVDARYLKEYLRCFIIEKEIAAGGNVVEELFAHLDTLELQNKPLPDEFSTETGLFDFFRKIHRTKFFKENASVKRFESLVEISTRELAQKHPMVFLEASKQLWDDNEGKDIDNDAGFLAVFSAHENEAIRAEFKTYHKYIAVIKADGDRIGKTIQAIFDMPNATGLVKEFSEALFNWAKEAKTIIENYKGVPIYIGGDDLLAFVPVANGDKSIATLMREIDDAFDRAMAKVKVATGQNPSLSYGVAISYYKYPLFEAMGKVDELLHHAKDFSDEKNAVCIRVLKHSGSELKTTLTKKKGGTFEHLEDIMKHLSKEKSFLNSVMYSLCENEPVLKIIGTNAERFENFLHNNFEDYAKGNANSEFLKTVQRYLPPEFALVKTLTGKREKETDNEHLDRVTGIALNNVYSTLRIARFIKGMDDDK